MAFWIVGIGLALALVGMAAYVIGARLPEEHSVEASAFIANRTPPIVAARIRDVEHCSVWRRGVSAVVVMRDVSSVTFEETGSNGKVTYRQTAPKPNAEIINEIISDGMPYGGKWTIRIESINGGSTVSIREDGFVKPPMFRFLARFVFGYSGSINQFLKDLAEAERVL